MNEEVGDMRTAHRYRKGVNTTEGDWTCYTRMQIEIMG